MSKRDLSKIMDDYSQKDMSSNTEACHYDNLREHGYSRDEARRVARKAADVTQRGLDTGADALAGGSRGIKTRAEPAESKAPAMPWLRWKDDE